MRAATAPTTEWQRRIRNVFDACEAGLNVLFEAARCRELWLHGEFYRQLRPVDPRFCINTDHSTTQVDLLGYSPASMVAEVKVGSVCRGFGKKCEYNISQVKRDSERLVAIQSGPESVDEAYQMLIIETVGTPDSYGRQAMAVRFDAIELAPLEYDNFIVRIWQYPRRCAA